VAAGAESHGEQQVRVSQLGIKMDEIELNPIMMQWASTHFSSIEKIASQHDKWIKKEHMQDTSDKTTQ